MRKFIALLLSLIFAAAALAIPVFAAEQNTLTLHFYATSEEQPLINAKFFIYLVAEPDGNGGYTLTKDFEAYPIDLSALEGNDSGLLTETAGTLSAFAGLYVDPYRDGMTNARGNVTFNGLPDGLYLVCGDPLIQNEGSENESVYIPQPILIFLPYPYDDGTFGRDMTLDVKYIYRQSSDQSDPAELTVCKVWNDNGDHPDSVTVQLICDGKIFDEVILNYNKNWRHTWTIDPDHVWQIAEKSVPEGYTVLVEQDGYYFTITNTNDSQEDPPVTPPAGPFVPPSDEHQPSDPSDPSDSENIIDGDDDKLPAEPADTSEDELPDEPADTAPEETPEAVENNDIPSKDDPALPQTGQLWWPVLILLGIGIPLSGVGIVLRKKGREDNEKR